MNVDELTINTIRVLSAEAIEKAASGHPGLPLGAAPAAYTLWSRAMKHNPRNPKWQNRDRFVLSAGHGSMLLYSLLHLFGYGLTMDDLKNFRQFGSKTPGHPEYGHTAGVETTTGPLGQGIANAVGMAIAETYLAAKFNRPGFPVVDHFTYALCGDGCLMEGVSGEAASLAGTLKLGKLIVLYDSNNISIEGSTDLAFTENVAARFQAYGWQVITVLDGNSVSGIETALGMARAEKEKPTLIEIKTRIGFGSPNKAGKASAHGEPLGKDELINTKANLSWEYGDDFHVPREVRSHMEKLSDKGALKEELWRVLFVDYKKEFPELAAEYESWMAGKPPMELLDAPEFWDYEGDMATRTSSEKVLNKLSAVIPNLIGGSADLAPSNKSVMKDREYYSPEVRGGANIHFGVREFAMTAIASGIAAHGGLKPYIAGFLVFSDYMKSGLRMQALMKLPVISIFTHDSIGVGEDGPTHQPVEQLAALRSIPGYRVFRPCDSRETAAGWYAALTKGGPTALVLTRQNLKELPGTGRDALRGAYILRDAENPDIILMSTGSEVELIYRAWEALKEKGVSARVVSMPSWELFEEQDAEYKERVLPSGNRVRIAVEALSSFGWHKYVGLDGEIISMDTFGASAPADRLFREFGFTVDAVVEKALMLLDKK